MTTDENELTLPVDLCAADGVRLNPAAKGWSRRPILRANLAGRWGRTKRWDYWAILTDGFALSVTYADVDYIGIADVWWVNLATGATGGKECVVPLAKGINLPDTPGDVPLEWSAQGLEIALTTVSDGTRIVGSWSEADGRTSEIDVFIADPPQHESLNVVIPWSERVFQYTSKHQARPVSGHVRIGGKQHTFDDERRAWGVLDVGRGRWPYSTKWNWGGGAGLDSTGAAVIGLQLGGQWTAGTPNTENGILVDGRLSKIGRELSWNYDWSHPMRPWRVSDSEGQIDVTLTPTFDRHSSTNLLLLSTEVHQVFGTWSGTVTDDDGATFSIEKVCGFAEESRSRW